MIIAHLTPGEIVIPPSLQSPELMHLLQRVFGSREMLLRFTAGSGHEQVNPVSGYAAFFDLFETVENLARRAARRLDQLKGQLEGYPEGCSPSLSAGRNFCYQEDDHQMYEEKDGRWVPGHPLPPSDGTRG
ncbi:hypothetical protein [Magnetospira sp. QH-2]|uniref:hypothetical protein n=1 Tax=Magnetospira sp. (strain QH-2) TaxID=1288970 RepID=UPI0003E80BF7|nr:hypothetical protein [Magnetospira sp. QH-2]CCQ72342.1 protein of unknown function [Magnetospira sp. QH-2]